MLSFDKSLLTAAELRMLNALTCDRGQGSSSLVFCGSLDSINVGLKALKYESRATKTRDSLIIKVTDGGDMPPATNRVVTRKIEMKVD